MIPDYSAARAAARAFKNESSSTGNLARAYLALTDKKKEPLTAQQRALYDFIAESIEQKGYAPTFEEIAGHFFYRSLATVHEHLGNLERKGWIRRTYNEARGIALVEGAEVTA